MTTTQLRPFAAGVADWSSLMGAFFVGLSDVTRVQIVTLLLNEGEKSVSEIVERVGLSQGRVSTHLACLRTCGFVSSRRDGRFTRYSVTDQRVGEILRVAHSMLADNAERILSCELVTEPGKGESK